MLYQKYSQGGGLEFPDGIVSLEYVLYTFMEMTRIPPAGTCLAGNQRPEWAGWLLPRVCHPWHSRTIVAGVVATGPAAAVCVTLRLLWLLLRVSGTRLLFDFGDSKVRFYRQNFAALPTVDADCYRHLFTHISPRNVIAIVRFPSVRVSLCSSALNCLTDECAWLRLWLLWWWLRM